MFGIDDLLVGSLVGGGISALGSIFGGKTQANSADKASQAQQQQFQQTRQDLMPWQQTGTMALGDLSSFLGIGPNGQFNPNAPGVKPFSPSDLTTDPSYQWRLQQGQNAIQNSRAAMGGALSGGTLKDLTNYAQGAASQEYQSAYNRYNQNVNNIYQRLYNQSASGQNAAAQIGGFGANAANNIAGNTIGAGNANAAGIVGATNAVNSGIGNGINNYLLSQLLPGGGSGGGASGIPAGWGGIPLDPWYG